MPARRLLLLLCVPVFLAVTVACPVETVYPGDVVVGTFNFNARVDWARSTCDAGSPNFRGTADGGFTFAGTFSRDSVDGGAWFTVDGYSRKAAYVAESQTYTSPHRAGAKLPSCDPTCEGSEIEEGMAVMVLSASQSTRIGAKCVNLGDGGVPMGEGVTPPGPTVNGYDAERACGELKVSFIPAQTASCKCQPGCAAVYSVEGTRRFQ
jgi:hypothetical protein